MKKLLLLAVVSAAALCAQPTTIYLELGVNAEAVEPWGGSLRLSGGDIVSLEGRHFSPEDSIIGADRWQVSTRREQIEGFARMNYNEMSPAELPPTQYSPLGVYAVVNAPAGARVSVSTEQGDFAFRLDQLSHVAKPFLEGRVMASVAPTVEPLTTQQYEDDEPAIATLSDGSIAAAWIGYKDSADRVFVRTQRNGAWSAPEEVTPAPGDLWRVSLAADSNGGLWAFWSQRDGVSWDIWGRHKTGDSWGRAEKISEGGSNTFHRASSSADGSVFVVWQSFRGPGMESQADIYGRRWNAEGWSPEAQLSDSPANDWEPFVAGGKGGAAYVVWDGYEDGNYDVFFRDFDGNDLGPVRRVTKSPRFQAHATVAVDAQGRPWVAWDESGTNWGKDVGYLITPSMGVPLHQERSLEVVMWDGGKWVTPKKNLQPFYVYQLFPNFENPQIHFDGQGVLNMVFRHWTRTQAHNIGAPLMWENFLTRFDGERWTTPIPLAHSAGSIEKRPAMTRDASGAIQAAWMTDNRTFQSMIPKNAEIYFATLGSAGSPPAYGSEQFKAFVEPYAEEVPIHPTEEQDVAAIRDYTIEAGAKKLKIYRGDMHRHTDVSQDFKYDGSLLEVYRYALDVTGFDYIVPTDHQLGFDQEFTWWQDEKLKDLFHVQDRFVPLFGYERSVNYPNGHRNVIFAKRGTRTLPVAPDERRGDTRTGPILYPYLRANDGISMPHSSGTAQGTDFGDNDPELEPLLEIFQGYRASYEYMGAPLAASPQKLREQRSGFNPLGYYWNALEKGYKMGVQASTDHWSTHMSYAMIISEDFTRESMFAAIKARHAYGATDNIILDFQGEANGQTAIMGDIMDSDTAPTLTIHAQGTDRIKQLVIVKNEAIIYERRPNADSVTLRYRDTDFEPGSNYYYVRVLQNNGMVAWSSPIWVE